MTPAPKDSGHQDCIASVGDVSETYWSLIHKQVSIPKALKIPKAKEALDKEWDRLQKKRVWIMETVEDKKVVEERCQKQGVECEFCAIMVLCHNKNSEFEFELPLNDRT